MESFKTLYRAAVMLGSLVVGALAYRAYGPELEKLAPVVERVRQLAVETLSPDDEATGTADDSLLRSDMPSPAEFTTNQSTGATPLAPAAIVDSNIEPAGIWDTDSDSTPSVLPAAAPPLAAGRVPAAAPGSAVSAVVHELNELGVSQYTLAGWGEGGKFFRFQCSAPWGTQAGYSRHFESIADDPTQAAQQVLEQVRQWHMASGDAAMRR